MKPKPPFQLLVLDDDGREIFNTYVSEDGSQGYDISDRTQCDDLGQAIIDNLKSPLSGEEPKWICP